MLKEIWNALLNIVTPSMTAAEVAASLDKLASERTERLDWRTSIVDLMKLLNLDSSMNARKMLADELGYSGISGSAEGNIWLHREVLRKVGERGIAVPR